MYRELKAIPDLVLHPAEALAKYTAARLGGVADMVAIAKTNTALTAAVCFAHQKHIPWLILGGGTNVLLADRGFRGLVLINQAKERTISAETGLVTADAGMNLSTLARLCMGDGLQGLEWCVSVPGTVGGAVVNNAGAHGSDIAHNLHHAVVLDVHHPTTTSIWPLEAMDYAYRHSALKGQHGRYVVLSAQFQLDPQHDPAALKAQADAFITHRKSTQPPGASLGSIFKNPPNDYAGRLVEVCGLKGYRLGGVQVSPLHGNFFVNDEHGTAAEYSALIDHVQATVEAQTGVHLDIEVERLGDGF